MSHLKQGDKPEEMLKAVIDKAVKNGWDKEIPHSMFSFEFNNWNWHNTIFCHNFAKAYWGEGEHIFDVYGNCNYCDSFQKEGTSYHWQYHLQQAVISENPLLYYFERL